MIRLARRMVEKPWGVDRLPAPFPAHGGGRIGEVWFESPAALSSILVKHIFTSESLSVQVHPDDLQAAAMGQPGGGKEECWLVTDAQPGARLGIGFVRPVDPATIRQAALDGSIERLLAWHQVKRGDFFHIPAGTVHAIGAGVSLIEVQQNSDVTYRLYDYGRDRPLHLDAGLAVARGQPHNPAMRRHFATLAGDAQELICGRNFSVHLLAGPFSGSCVVQEREVRGAPCIILPLSGSVRVDDETLEPGCAGFLGSGGPIALDETGSCLIVRGAMNG